MKSMIIIRDLYIPNRNDYIPIDTVVAGEKLFSPCRNHLCYDHKNCLDVIYKIYYRGKEIITCYHHIIELDIPWKRLT